MSTTHRQYQAVLTHATRLEKALSKLTAEHVGNDEQMLEMMKLKIQIARIQPKHVVMSWGNKRIQCIKVIRDHLRLTLQDAKDMTDQPLPYVLPQNPSLIADLKWVGAEIR